jgi:hypothetical protein
MVTRCETESAAIDNNAAAVVNEDVMRVPETKRRCGRMNQRAGSHCERTAGFDAGFV